MSLFISLYSEVILTFGQSTSVEEFLQTAAKKRQFKVMVVESAPSLNGQRMAHSLAQHGMDVTVLPDSAVFAMMARVNKVVVPAAAVVANGGLIAQSGLQNIALAAKKYSVPVVCVAGLIKLCPLYAHDLDVLNELIAPSNIYNYEDTVENVWRWMGTGWLLRPWWSVGVWECGRLTDAVCVWLVGCSWRC